jgi:hypothetical protein
MSSELTNTLRYREEWLHEGVNMIRPWFKDRNKPISEKIFISCGFPKGRHGRGRAIGQCWPPQATKNGVVQMFICPTLDNPVEVLATAVHECCHEACGNECGHKGPFKELALSLGLAGKMTATYAEEGTPLHDALSSIAESLGPYPHSGMILKTKEKKPSKWIRLQSRIIEEYTLVISKDSIDAHGWPVDPHGMALVPKKEWEWDGGRPIPGTEDDN